MTGEWLGGPSSDRRGRGAAKRRPPDRPAGNNPGEVWTWRRVRCPECYRRGRKGTDLRMTRSASPTSYYVCLQCGWRFAATEEIDFDAAAGPAPSA